MDPLGCIMGSELRSTALQGLYDLKPDVRDCPHPWRSAILISPESLSRKTHRRRLLFPSVRLQDRPPAARFG